MAPAYLMLGGNPAMDQHPIQGGLEILLVMSRHATETGISSGLTGHLAPRQTSSLPVLYYNYLSLIDQAGSLYWRILTEVVSTDQMQ